MDTKISPEVVVPAIRQLPADEFPKGGKFCYDPTELSAPDASNPFSFFDWQGQNDIKSTLVRFGGIENIIQCFDSNMVKGLTTEQAKDSERISKYGDNKPEEREALTYWEIVWEGLHDVTLLVLITAAIVSIITGIISEGAATGWIDGVAILAAVVLILNVTAINDLQKDRQFRQLSAINNRKTIKALRNGGLIELLTEDIVAGDILYITAGDTIPADLYFLHGNNVKIDESKLTGEPDQLKKSAEKPFVVSSSECHDGSFHGLVISVGKNSVYGKMRSMIEGGNDEGTPLQLKLENLTTQISLVGAAIGVLVIIIMLLIHLIEYFTGKGTLGNDGKPKWTSSNWNSLISFFITGVTILVVAIPEGLPLAVTIALAYSVKRMMKDNNLVRHLSACETMGGANTICSDKTGTLTMGQMTVMQGWIYRENSEDESLFLNKFEQLSAEERDSFIDHFRQLPHNLLNLLVENCCLNNDAFLIKEDDKPERGNGSSLDIALIKFTREIDDKYEYTLIRQLYPKLEDILLSSKNLENYKQYVVKMNPFHSNRKRSSVIIKLPNGKFRIYVKGAPEMIIRLCDNTISDSGKNMKLTGTFQEDSDGKVKGDGSRYKIVQHCILPMAKTGLRVIGFAYRDFDTAQNWDDTIEFKTEDQKGVGSCPSAETGLTFAGLIGVQDPPRPEVPAAVKDCQKAGIFVRMVTGDNLETAKAIATQVHIFHRDGYTDGQGKKWPPGKCITGPQFRESVGGLVLPPHFYHECNCKDCSQEPSYKPGWTTPKPPVHYGYPSIVGHSSEDCKFWQLYGNKKGCNDECKRRGCVKQMKKADDQTELQKYQVIRNQFVFDQYVDTLQVMARSAPSDKHMLVSGLMERRLVVAVTGDGTNDGPALSKSNVGFAMGIAGTSVAKDASDIILMDDNFRSIVKAVLWGRNVYDSIRKFLQFQLTVNAVACTLAFLSACVIKESPLKPIQMLWVNLIMDTFASLALATEIPTVKLLDRPPYHRDESLISRCMFRNIIGSFFYQFITVVIFTFWGEEFIDVPIGTHLETSAPPTEHLTMVFHVFVLMQVFNEINSRKIHNEANIFKGIFDNYMFLAIVIGTFAVQFIIVQFGGKALSTAPLSFIFHLVCILFGFISLFVYQLIRLIPHKWFLDLGRKDQPGNTFDFLQRARSRLYKSSIPSIAGDFGMQGRTKLRIFEN